MRETSDPADADPPARAAETRALLAGIAAYRRHPWRRTLPDPPCVWQEGESRLLDYGPTGEAKGTRGRDAGVPTLFVPSLINRAYVLDLAPDRSMLRWLAGAGIRPMLLDWGWPGERERQFRLTDYVAGRLERAMEAAVRIAEAGVVLAGYCMGGTLAVAAAQRRPDLLRGLVLLATPWDFHAGDPAAAERARSAARLLEPTLAALGTLPIDAIQAMFAQADPGSIAAKFQAFAAMPQDSERARMFVALEDWLNDGVPLAAPVARECIDGWYGANTPAIGDWLVAGRPVEPRELALPTLVVAPKRDRIVPPAASIPLASLIARADLHEPASGHIGMVVGTSAERDLWRTLSAWVGGLSARRMPALRRA